jgi:hypothetical protein
MTDNKVFITNAENICIPALEPATSKLSHVIANYLDINLL